MPYTANQIYRFRKAFKRDEKFIPHPVGLYSKPVMTDEDSAVSVVYFHANAKERRRIKKDPQRFIDDAISYGDINSEGCNCSRCRLDYDCCGRMFVAATELTRYRRGYKVVQYWTRNV